MAFLDFISQWYNLSYVVALALAMALFALKLVGLGMSDSDVDADADADVDVDVDHDLDVDLDHDLDVDVDHDVDIDVDHDVAVGGDVDMDVDAGVDADVYADANVDGVADGISTLTAILLFFNVGKVPFVVVLECFLLGFGLTGLFVTEKLVLQAETGGEPFPAGSHLFLYSMPAALLVGVVLSKALSQVWAKILPSVETKAVTRRSLVGHEAVVASVKIDEKNGRATVTDRDGDLHTVFCRTVRGIPPVPKGERVVLVRYVRKGDEYLVRRPTESQPSQSQDS